MAGLRTAGLAVAAGAAWGASAQGLPGAGGTVSASDMPAEALSRRACKFRPLPQDLDEGFRGPGGSALISDVFGLPAAALARGGHNVSAAVHSDGFLLGASVQVNFAAGTSITMEVFQPGGQVTRCKPSWGAGGLGKRCTIVDTPLQAGPLVLSFRASGLGDAAAPAEGLANPAACVSVRVDLEIRSRASVTQTGQCGQAEEVPAQLTSTDERRVLMRSTARVREGPGSWGVVWSTALPTPPGDGATSSMLFARVTFPTFVLPLQFLLEERHDDGFSAEPVCHLRCVGGTPLSVGQAMQRALHSGVHYKLWLLGTKSEHSPCVNFDLELSLAPAPTSSMQSQFVGPPAWLCEGAPWPSRLEQTHNGDAFAIGAGISSDTAGAVLRGRHFSLHDVFELTRPARVACHGGPGGCEAETGNGDAFHTMELVVAVPSLLRLTTRGASIPARPVLLRAAAAEAWRLLAAGPQQSQVRAPSVRLPAGGGEFDHGIHAELSPGVYTLLFLEGHITGGLRNCASVMLRLELAPRDGPGMPQASACARDAPLGFLEELAQRLSSPLEEAMDRSEDYQLTLPRPAMGPDALLQNMEGLEVLGRSRIRFGDDAGQAQGRYPVLLRAKVESPFLLADFGMQVFADGVAMAEPQVQGDGSGYLIVAGPLALGVLYEVVLYHVPRYLLLESSSGGQLPQPQCITFSIDVAAVRAAASIPAATGRPSLLPLPGAALCGLTSRELPRSLRLNPAAQPMLLLEGDFPLPAGGAHHDLLLEGSITPASRVLLRATVASADAEVRLEQASAGVVHTSSALSVAGLAEDRAILVLDGDAANGAGLRISAARLPTTAVCPTMRLHVVAVPVDSLPTCPWTYGVGGVGGGNAAAADFQGRLHDALSPQPASTARLRQFSLPLAGSGWTVVAPFEVKDALAELRFELGIQPPWLPVEAVIKTFIDNNSGEGASSTGPGSYWARSRVAGHRITMNVPSLPKGRYTVQLLASSDEALERHCAMVSASVALVEPQGHDTANYRQEMLNMPELMAVLPPPTSLTPLWWPLEDVAHLLTSQVYAVPPSGAVMRLQVPGPSLLRLLAEPADLLSPRMTIQVFQGTRTILYPTEGIGSVPIALPEAGLYQVKLQPNTAAAAAAGCAACPSKPAIPFMVVAELMRQSKEEASGSCESLAGASSAAQQLGQPRQPGVANWHSKREFRLDELNKPLVIPINVPEPAVVLITAWSPSFAAHYIRAALHTEEGMWVGEQRLRLSALEIELPTGEYKMHVQEVSPSHVNMGRKECLSFGVAVTVAAFSPVLSSSSPAWGLPASSFAGAPGAAAAAWSVGLGARCDGLGASPLPLDFFSSDGGASHLGGFVRSTSGGRLLVRQRFLLTDIHDGRKKVFLRPGGDEFLRVIVASADAFSVEVALEDSSHHDIAPTSSWTHGTAGWSFSYVFPPSDSRGYWLAFHREHRDAMLSGCAAFDLLLQLGSRSDVQSMTRCPPGAAQGAKNLVEEAVENGSGSAFVQVPAGSTVSEAIEVGVTAPSFVEIEVQFNILLSVVSLRQQGVAAQLQASAQLGAVGFPEQPLNAHAVLQLRLLPGRHTLVMEHAFAFPRSAVDVGPMPCFPLRLVVRQTPWLPGSPAVATSPSLTVPSLPSGFDLAVATVTPPSGVGANSAGVLASAVAAAPTLGGVPPTSMAADAAGGSVWLWSYGALLGLLGSQQLSGSPSASLPLRLCGEESPYLVHFQGPGTVTKPPWTGGSTGEDVRSLLASPSAPGAAAALHPGGAGARGPLAWPSCAPPAAAPAQQPQQEPQQFLGGAELPGPPPIIHSGKLAQAAGSAALGAAASDADINPAGTSWVQLFSWVCLAALVLVGLRYRLPWLCQSQWPQGGRSGQRGRQGDRPTEIGSVVEITSPSGWRSGSGAGVPSSDAVTGGAGLGYYGAISDVDA